MKKIRGKQIQDNTIEQRSISVSTDSIIENNSATNKQYVINRVNQSLSGLYQSKLNLNMTALVATSGDLACEKGVIEFPISPVMIKLNGILMSVGSDKDFYFSPDGGTTKRENGYAEKGDKLYWNSSDYNLDDQDEIDLVYLVGYEYVEGGNGDTVELNPIYKSIVVKFTGDPGDTMFVVINGSTIEVGNVGGNFVWDIDGPDEYTFTEINESIVVTVDGEEYTIWFDGFGSLIFSVRKGNWKPESEPEFLFYVNNSPKIVKFDSNPFGTTMLEQSPSSPLAKLILEYNNLLYFTNNSTSNPTIHTVSVNDLTTIINNGLSYLGQTRKILRDEQYLYVCGDVNTNPAPRVYRYNLNDLSHNSTNDRGQSWTSPGHPYYHRLHDMCIIDRKLYVVSKLTTGVFDIREFNLDSFTSAFSNDNRYFNMNFNGLTSDGINLFVSSSSGTGDYGINKINPNNLSVLDISPKKVYYGICEHDGYIYTSEYIDSNTCKIHKLNGSNLSSVPVESESISSSYVTNIKIFNNKLYASFITNSGKCRIYKFDPNLLTIEDSYIYDGGIIYDFLIT